MTKTLTEHDLAELRRECLDASGHPERHRRVVKIPTEALKALLDGYREPNPWDDIPKTKGD